MRLLDNDSDAKSHASRVVVGESLQQRAGPAQSELINNQFLLNCMTTNTVMMKTMRTRISRLAGENEQHYRTLRVTW